MHSAGSSSSFFSPAVGGSTARCVSVQIPTRQLVDCLLSPHYSSSSRTIMNDQGGIIDPVELAFAVVALQNSRSSSGFDIAEEQPEHFDFAATQSTLYEQQQQQQCPQHALHEHILSSLHSATSHHNPLQQQQQQYNHNFQHHPSEYTYDDNSNDNDNVEDTMEQRLVRSRERNREHARRTRLRKKAQLESLRLKAKCLEAERQQLKQQVEECSIASILIGLSGGMNDSLEDDEETQKLLESSSDPKSDKFALLAGGGKRKRFVSDAVNSALLDAQKSLKVDIDGETILIGTGKTQINWKTGVYSDEDGVHSKLTAEQLEMLRRERNRMHAKMTRDRKKCYIATIQKTIHELESDVSRLKDVLAKVQESQPVTPAPSPSLNSVQTPSLPTESEDLKSAKQQQGQKLAPPISEVSQSHNTKNEQILKDDRKAPLCTPFRLCS